MSANLICTQGRVHASSRQPWTKLFSGRTASFPKLQAASGFVGFYLVCDEANGINTAIVVWESKADAESFDVTGNQWRRRSRIWATRSRARIVAKR